MSLKRRTSQDSAALVSRIAANTQFGSLDLTTWLNEQLNFQSGDRLLDLGCGTGRHLSAFAKAGARCTGLDVSQDSLSVARDICGPDIVLHHRSMANLSGIAGPFDTIAAIYALYYSPDVRSTLEQAHALLAPGGRIVVVGPYSDNNAAWFNFIGQFMVLPEAVKHSTTDFMFDKALRFACDNFPSIRCQRFENRIVIPSLEELRRYWRSNVYYDERLDPAFEAAAERHFVSHLNFSYNKVGLLVEMRL